MRFISSYSPVYISVLAATWRCSCQAYHNYPQVHGVHYYIVARTAALHSRVYWLLELQVSSICPVTESNGLISDEKGLAHTTSCCVTSCCALVARRVGGVVRVKVRECESRVKMTGLSFSSSLLPSQPKVLRAFRLLLYFLLEVLRCLSCCKGLSFLSFRLKRCGARDGLELHSGSVEDGLWRCLPTIGVGNGLRIRILANTSLETWVQLSGGGLAEDLPLVNGGDGGHLACVLEVSGAA